MNGPSASGVTDYDDLLKEELGEEAARKGTLEQRGLAVITTSGVLVTLLFGLGALSTKREATFDLSGCAETALGVALVLFIGAAIAALGTNWPLAYDQARPDDVEDLLNASPIAPSEEARKDVAFVRVAELRSARTQNARKANMLIGAMALEVAAVVAVAIAVWDVLSPF